MWAMTKAVLWKAMLGVGCVVGTVAIWIVILNLMDISGERVVSIPGQGFVPTGTRWCEQYPSQSPTPWMWLSYWFSCDDGVWIPRLRKSRAEVPSPPPEASSPPPEASSPPSGIAVLADTAAAFTGIVESKTVARSSP